jgi:hypothetical protein
MSYNKKFSILYHLGFLWVLPVSIIFWVIFGLLYILGQIDVVMWSRDLMLIWDVKNGGWLDRKFLTGKGWLGFAAGCNILVADTDGERWQRTIKHERRHVLQQYLFGIFFIILYILESVRIYLMCPNLHSYYDNRFEIDARKAAGQLVKIPKELWSDGEKDRWIFW